MPTKAKTFTAAEQTLDISGSADGPSLAVIQVEGSGTLTLLAEGQVGGATAWVACQIINLNTGAGAASITAAGLYSLQTSGFNARLRCSAYTSGNLTARANLTGGIS